MTESAERNFIRLCVASALALSAVAAFRTFRSGTATHHSDAQLRALAATVPAIGDSTASASLIIATDFQCEFCRVLHDSLERVRTSQPTRLTIRIVPFPLTAIHPTAEANAKAFVCAAENGLQERANDALYKIGETINTISVGELAAAIGWKMKPELLSTCMSSEKTKKFVADSRAAVLAAGATGTPTTWVNGRRFDGLVPLDSLLASTR